jgi:hypothetical protein
MEQQLGFSNPKHGIRKLERGFPCSMVCLGATILGFDFALPSPPTWCRARAPRTEYKTHLQKVSSEASMFRKSGKRLETLICRYSIPPLCSGDDRNRLEACTPLLQAAVLMFTDDHTYSLYHNL